MYLDNELEEEMQDQVLAWKTVLPYKEWFDWEEESCIKDKD